MMQAFGRVKPGVTIEKARADLDVVAAGMQASYPDVYRSRPTAIASPPIPLQEELTRDVQDDAAGPARHRGIRAADRLRQRREPDARAHGAARARDRDPRGARRQPAAAAAPAADRKHAAGAPRRGARASRWPRGASTCWSSTRSASRRARPTSRSTAPSSSTRSSSRWSTGLVFGSVPALSGAARIAPALRDGGRTTQNRQSVRSALIVVQVAASFMLLIGAGLTLRTVINLQRVDPGFKTDNLLTMRIDLNFSKYKEDADARVLGAARGAAEAGTGRRRRRAEAARSRSTNWAPFTGRCRSRGASCAPNDAAAASTSASPRPTTSPRSASPLRERPHVPTSEPIGDRGTIESVA